VLNVLLGSPLALYLSNRAQQCHHTQPGVHAVVILLAAPRYLQVTSSGDGVKVVKVGESSEVTDAHVFKVWDGCERTTGPILLVCTLQASFVIRPPTTSGRRALLCGPVRMRL
jgi:hypothetical protein